MVNTIEETQTDSQNKVTMSEESKIAYLQMIQSNIERMSTSSAIFKGFAATIVAGISAISYSDLNNWILLMSFLPVICFMLLDIYYLKLEKRFRVLFEMIRNEKGTALFDLTPPKLNKTEKKKYKARVIDIFKSPSIFLFYLVLIIISIIVIVLKFVNTI